MTRTLLACLLTAAFFAPVAAHADPLICADLRPVYVKNVEVDPPNVCLL